MGKQHIRKIEDCGAAPFCVGQAHVTRAMGQWDNHRTISPVHWSIGPYLFTGQHTVLVPWLAAVPVVLANGCVQVPWESEPGGEKRGGEGGWRKGERMQASPSPSEQGGRGALRKRKLSTCPIMVFSPALCAWLPVHVEILGAAVHVEHEGLCGHLVDDLHGIRAWDQVRVRARVGNGGCRKERWPEQGHQYGTCCDPHFLAGHWTSLNSDPEGHRFSNLPGEAPQNP